MTVGMVGEEDGAHERLKVDTCYLYALRIDTAIQFQDKVVACLKFSVRNYGDLVYEFI